MPLFICATAVVLEAKKSAESPEFSVTIAVQIGKNTEEPGELHVKVWPSQDNDVQIPVVDCMYHLEGKMTEVNGSLLIEATRLIAIPAMAPIAPTIYGTAMFEKKQSDASMLLAAPCYAAKTKGRIEIAAIFSARQYSKFIAELHPNQEIFIQGVLDGLKSGSEVNLTGSHFYYLNKGSSGVSGGHVPSVPVGTSPKKFWKKFSAEEQATTETEQLEDDVADKGKGTKKSRRV